MRGPRLESAARCSTYFSLRERHSGLGSSKVSVQASTIVATPSPKCARICSTIA